MANFEEARAYLQLTRTRCREYESKLSRCEFLWALATRTTTVLSGMPRGGGLPEGSSTMENATVNLTELAQEVQSAVDDLAEKISQATEIIEQVVNVKYRVVLEMRYLGLCSWKEIERKQKWSHAQVMNFHNQVVLAVQQVLNRDRYEEYIVSRGLQTMAEI